MGTIKATNIEPIADNGTVTLGSSGDNLVLGSGAKSSFLYPAFEASLSSDQTLSDAVETKVQFDNEIFDSNNCYDATTNYRFLPTVAGKYFVYLKINFVGSGGINDTFTKIKKNGVNQIIDLNNDSALVQQAQITMGVIDMNGTSDYIEGFAVNDVAVGSTCSLDADNRKTTFGAYRIIGA